MLYDTTELLAGARRGIEGGEGEAWLQHVRSMPVERIEEGHGRIGRGYEVPEDREGRRAPGTGDGSGAGINGLVLIGCPAPAPSDADGETVPGRRVERGEVEVGRRRTGGSRDGGRGRYEPGVHGHFFRVPVTALAEGLVGVRSRALRSGVRPGEERQPLDHGLALFVIGIGKDHRVEVLRP